MNNIEQTTTEYWDYVIIGAGPAGLQLAYFLEQTGRNYIILEKGEGAGTFFQTFPRHGKLISVNKVYTGSDDPETNLRQDWNSLLSDDEDLLFRNYSKEYFPGSKDYVTYLNDFANKLDLNVRYGVTVNCVSRPDDFHVEDQTGRTFVAQKLIVATGIFKPYIPDIPGIELVERYTEVSVDPEDFINQDVLIIGKGNSAFETADNLIPTTAVLHVASPEPLRMAWESHYVGNLRAVNNNFVDTYQLKSQNAILDAEIENISKQDDKFVVSVRYTHANGECEDLIYDRVIACTGFRFDNSFFAPDCTPALSHDDRFPAQTEAWESANIPDLFFAGALMQERGYKKSTSAFIHGFRYNVRALYRILEEKYHDVPWPSQAYARSAGDLTQAIIRRINHSSALWQQYGYFCDLIVLGEHKAEYLPDLSINFAHEHMVSDEDEYLTVSLEFGHAKGDLFRVVRSARAEDAAESTFLHPVIRHYRHKTLIGKHHLLEDLYADWSKEAIHAEPLFAFLEDQLDMAAQAAHMLKSHLLPA